MIPQNLEELLHSTTVGNIHGEDLQDTISHLEEMLNFDGGLCVISKIYSSDQAVSKMSVNVKTDPKSGQTERLLALEYKSTVSVNCIEVFYYHPAEVVQFGNLESEI